MNATAVNMDFEINKRQLINGNKNNDSVRNTDTEHSTEVIEMPTNKVHEDIQIIQVDNLSQQKTKLNTIDKNRPFKFTRISQENPSNNSSLKAQQDDKVLNSHPTLSLPCAENSGRSSSRLRTVSKKYPSNIYTT